MIDLADFGYTETMFSDESIDIPARVVAVHKERYELICEQGQIFGRLKTKIYFNDGLENFPTVGDYVLIHYNENGDSQIIKTFKRKTFFSRRDPTPGRGEQAVAANFDYVFIMESLNKDFNINRTQRYLTLAWQSGATPVIILTKADLAENYDSQIRELEGIAVGVNIHAVSAITGYGIDSLSQYFQPRKTTVFLGSSGVGKSSLVNALSKLDIMVVKTIRKDDDKGRHTTTHRQLIMLPSGAMIIDTPGMRELGMWDISVGLGETFSDIEKLFTQCKFTNCTHQSEPGCGILTALENGTLELSQWKNYLQLKREARFTDSKAKISNKKKQTTQRKYTKNDRKFKLED